MKSIIISAVVALLAQQAHAQDRQTEQVGAWEVVTISDPITDEGRVIGILGTGRAFLGVKCDEPGLDSIYIQFNSADYLGGRGVRSAVRELTYRFDQGTPLTNGWRYNETYALQSDRARVSEFVALLSGASRVVMRATTYDYKQVTQVFEASPADTRQVLRRVYEGCKAGAPPIASEDGAGQ